MMIKEETREIERLNIAHLDSHWVQLNNNGYTIKETSNIIPIGNENTKFKKLLVEAIDESETTVMLCSFLLSDQEIVKSLLDAANREVRCYVLISTDAKLNDLLRTNISPFNEKTLQVHINILNKLVGKVLVRSSSNFHAKYLICDYGTSNVQGFISTANFTNEALSRSEELGIIIENTQIDSLYSFFRVGFWEEAENELVEIRQNIGEWQKIDFTQLEKSITIDNLLFTMKTDRILSTKNMSLFNRLNDLISNGKGPFIISSYLIDSEFQLIQSLLKRCESENISLTVLIRDKERNIPFIKAVNNIGGIIYEYEYIHAKFLISVNDKKAIVMSANFEDLGLMEGYEVGVFLNKNSFEEIYHVAKSWIDAAPFKWESSINIQSAKIGSIKFIGDKNSTQIEEVHEISKIERPKDLVKMKQLIEQPDKNFDFKFSKYAKKGKLKLNIIPPKMLESKKSRLATQNEIKSLLPENIDLKKIPLSIYRSGNTLYGKIKNWKDFDKVIQLGIDRKKINLVSE